MFLFKKDKEDKMVSLDSAPEELRKHILLESVPKYVTKWPADSEGSNNYE